MFVYLLSLMSSHDVLQAAHSAGLRCALQRLEDAECSAPQKRLLKASQEGVEGHRVGLQEEIVEIFKEKKSFSPLRGIGTSTSELFFSQSWLRS